MIHAAIGAAVLAVQQTADAIVATVAVLVFALRALFEAFGTVPGMA